MENWGTWVVSTPLPTAAGTGLSISQACHSALEITSPSTFRLSTYQREQPPCQVVFGCLASQCRDPSFISAGVPTWTCVMPVGR